jgi:hypothetical protein
MTVAIKLSHNQVVDLRLLRAASDYVGAYQYMRDVVHEQRIQETDTGRSYDLLKLETWLNRAASPLPPNSITTWTHQATSAAGSRGWAGRLCADLEARKNGGSRSALV